MAILLSEWTRRVFAKVADSPQFVSAAINALRGAIAGHQLMVLSERTFDMIVGWMVMATADVANDCIFWSRAVV